MVDSALQKTNDKFKKLKSWPLGDEELVTLIVAIYENDIFIYICEAKHQTSFQKNDVILFDRDTWFDFSNKVIQVHYKYTTLTFTANNSVQLMVDVNNKMYILQEIEYTGEGVYKFNSNALNLTHDMIQTLKRNIEDINKYILSYIYQTLLPNIIFESKPTICNSKTHLKENIKDDLLECICENLHQQLCKTFLCEGCLYDNSAQDKHPCLYGPSTMFNDEDVLTILDIKEIGKTYVKYYCTCVFENVPMFYMESFEEDIRSALKLYELKSQLVCHK